MLRFCQQVYACLSGKHPQTPLYRNMDIDIETNQPTNHALITKIVIILCCFEHPSFL